MESDLDTDKALFQNPQYLAALIDATPPIVGLPQGRACRELRENAGVSQLATAAACQVGLSSIARYESGAVTHSRSLESRPYRSLLAVWLRFAQLHNVELAASIRRQWPRLAPEESKLRRESSTKRPTALKPNNTKGENAA